MSTDENKALERRWFKAFDKGKDAVMAATDELYSNDFVLHSATGEDMHGLKDTKKYMDDIFSAFPDIHMTLDDIVAEGDKVTVRFTVTGTHKGRFMGASPTNKKMKIWSIQIDRIASGKFVEGWERTDTLGLMQQLGLIPKPKK
jgi:predicted ester cyclase